MSAAHKSENPSGQGWGFQGKSNVTKAEPNHLATAQRLGQCLIEAYTAGDRETAIKYQAAMLEAIRQQAPAKQAERFAQIDRAIAESDGCYFAMCGDRGRAKLAKEGGTA